MLKISTKNINPQKKLFHNQWVNVYATTLPLDKIEYWRENDRTIFTFERLVREKGKELKNISIEEITGFVAQQDIHKLQILAASIGRNGVQVPLIIRDDGKLLDGNRRYFAGKWLQMQCEEQGKELPEALSKIPIYVIREADLTDTLELKILAEANFIPDLKVAWPLDAQARAVAKFVRQIRKEKRLDKDGALAEVVGVFGISRQRATDLLDTLELTKKFIADSKNKDEEMRRRAIVEDKFVYFWEFRNKAMKGRGALDSDELDEVSNIIFQFMAKGQDNPIKNVKQIEPIIQAKRDRTAWQMLVSSKGSKLSLVVSAINEKKDVRKAEDKIRLFLGWLEEIEELSSNAKSLLREVATLAREKGRV